MIDKVKYFEILAREDKKDYIDKEEKIWSWATCTEEEAIKTLASLHILVMRWIERNTNIRYITHRDRDNMLTNGTQKTTLKRAIENLKKLIEKYCKESKFLTEEILSLEKNIKELRMEEFYIQGGRMTEKNSSIQLLYTKEIFSMLMDMHEIKTVSEYLDISTAAIKQACQDERLLNTKKLSKLWLVNLNECKKYWNVGCK